MVSDRQFGVCLMDSEKTIEGWAAPRSVGTVTKITKCEDVELGMQLFIETIGHSKFRIIETIPPSINMPQDYDPYTDEGHQKISELHEKLGVEKKMYISAKVEMIPDIEDPVPLDSWTKLVELWKNRIIYQALPQIVNPLQLDQVLAQHALTDVPTIDYLYSLVSLGATDPNMLQPILEANTMIDLLKRIEELFMIK